MARTHVDLDDCPAGADLLDSRDLAARLEALADERDRLEEAVSEAEADNDKDAMIEADGELEAFLDNYEDELAELEEMKTYVSDWSHGAALIHERHFTDYCRELVDDIGDLPRALPHYIVIDWEATADNLRADYTEFTYAGHTYLVRA